MQRKGEGAMEVPAISGGGYAPSTGMAAALQASSTVAVDMPAGSSGPMSITIANQVNMVYGQMSQGGGQVDEQSIKALIMLLLVQLMMNGGLDEQSKGLLDGLAEEFQSSGQTGMTMIAMQASSMIQMEFGGAEMPAVAIEASAGASLDMLA